MTEKEIIAGLMEFAIESHPTPALFRECLESGYCERMLKVIGPDVFDPNHRVRLVLAARESLERSEVTA